MYLTKQNLDSHCSTQRNACIYMVWKFIYIVTRHTCPNSLPLFNCEWYIVWTGDFAAALCLATSSLANDTDGIWDALDWSVRIVEGMEGSNNCCWWWWINGSCAAGEVVARRGWAGLGCMNEWGLVFEKCDSSQVRSGMPFSTLTLGARVVGLMAALNPSGNCCNWCCEKLNKFSWLFERPKSPPESDEALAMEEPLEEAGSTVNGKAGLLVPTASGEVFAWP